MRRKERLKTVNRGMLDTKKNEVQELLRGTQVVSPRELGLQLSTGWGSEKDPRPEPCGIQLPPSHAL